MGHFLFPQPIHSPSAAEWITAWTDPSLSPPPLFIFLLLTFIEAFQRNSPLAIHFLKWGYREKAHGPVCVCTCVWFRNEPEQAFIFLRFFFLSVAFSVPLVCSSTLKERSLKPCFYVPPYSSYSPLHPPLCLSLSPPLFTSLLYPSREAAQAFEPVLQFRVQELPNDSTRRHSLQFHLRKSIFPHGRRCPGLHKGFWDVPCTIGHSITRTEDTYPPSPRLYV